MGCVGSKTSSSYREGGDLSRNVKQGGFTNENFILSHKGGIKQHYEFDSKMLGQGTYGSVSKGTHKKTKAIRAVKTISKQSAQVKNLERFKQEIQIMKFVDHPSIVKLYETFEDASNIYLVMELCSGGELFDRIIAAGHFTEREAAGLMKQILQTIYYLHDNGIMHRDLKPENFLLYEANAPIDQSTIKIIDFGLSCGFKAGEKKKTKAGTPYYVSPEVVAGHYDEKCDEWSCGVIMYIMLCGYPPFYGDTDAEVINSVKKGFYSFVKADWKDVSSDAKDLISMLLKKHDTIRTTAQNALQHTWIKDKAPKCKEMHLGDNIVAHLKAFRSGSRLKKAALHVVATQMDDGQLKDLRDLFMQLDVNGDGQLSIKEITDGLDKGGMNLISGDELKKVLEQIDADGSGSIDYTEFLAATLDTKQY